ncbi:MAG: ATPase domain-containing protein [Desulfovermiculus sp.]
MIPLKMYTMSPNEFRMQFLIEGATEKVEPGVFVAFEESEPDLKKNVASLGWDLDFLCWQKQIAVEAMHISSDEMTEAGQYDLQGLDIQPRDPDLVWELAGLARVIVINQQTLDLYKAESENELLFNRVGNAVKYTRQEQIQSQAYMIPGPVPESCRILFIMEDTGYICRLLNKLQSF